MDSIYSHLKDFFTPRILAVLVLSLATVIVVYPRFSFLGSDSTFYVLIAESLFKGEGFKAFGEAHTVFSPFLSLIIVPLLYIAGDAEQAAHFVMLFAGMLSMPLLYWALVPAMPRLAAEYSAIFFGATATWIWSYVTDINAQTIASLLSILLLGLLTRFHIQNKSGKSGSALPLFLGVCVAVLYLTRPEYVILVLCLGVFIVCEGRKEISLKSRLFPLAMFVLGFLFFASPYLFFLKSATGEWTISGRVNEMVLIVTSDSYENLDAAGGASVVAPPALEEGVVASFLNNVPSFAKKFLDGMVNSEHNILTIYGFIGLFFFSLGVWFMWIGGMYWIFGAFLSLLAPMSAVALFQGGSPNYLVQFLYIFATCMGYGFYVWEESVYSSSRFGRYKKILVPAVLLITVLYLYYSVAQRYLFLPPDYTTPEVREMGLWMQHNITDPQTILSRKPEIAYYAGMHWRLLPNLESPHALDDFMEKQGIRYVVIDRHAHATRENIAAGFGTSTPTEFRLVHTITMHEVPAQLYEHIPATH